MSTLIASMFSVASVTFAYPNRPATFAEGPHYGADLLRRVGAGPMPSRASGGLFACRYSDLGLKVDDDADKFSHPGLVWSIAEGRYVRVDAEGSSKPVGGGRRSPIKWDRAGYNALAPDYGILTDLAKPIGDPMTDGDGERFPDVYGRVGVVKKGKSAEGTKDLVIFSRPFIKGWVGQILHRESLTAAGYCRGQVRGRAKRGSAWDYYGSVRDALEADLWIKAARMGRIYGAFPISEDRLVRIIGRLLYGRRIRQSYRVDDRSGLLRIASIGRLRFPRRMSGGIVAELIGQEKLETAGGIVMGMTPADRAWFNRQWGKDPVADAVLWAKYMAAPERKPRGERIEFNVRGAYNTTTGYYRLSDGGTFESDQAIRREERGIQHDQIRSYELAGLNRMIDNESRKIREIIAGNVAASLTDADLIALRRAEASMTRLSTIAGTYHADRIVKKAKRAVWTARIMDREAMIIRQTSEAWKPGQIGHERLA